MYGKKAVIISERVELASFFSLELSQMDSECEIIDGSRLPNGEYDFVIIDTDTVSTVYEAYGCPIMLVSEKNNCFFESEKCLLSWPVTIADFKKAYRTVFSNSDRTENEVNKHEYSNTVYVMNEAQGDTLVDGHKLSFTKTELAVLEALCSAEGIVSREKIMDIIGVQGGNASDVYVCKIRKKLETALEKRHIFTERCKGYRTDLKIVKKGPSQNFI